MSELLFSSRKAAVRSRVAELGADALLVDRMENIRYLAGFYGSAGLLLLRPDHADLIVDFRYAEQARNEGEGVEVIAVERGLLARLATHLAEIKVRRLAFESAHVTHARSREYANGSPQIEWLPTEGVVEGLRLFKNPTEVQAIDAAQGIADRAFERLMGDIRAGMTELEIAAALEYYMKLGGASAPSFETIVASGPRASLPHARPTDRKVSRGEMIKIDFGAKKNGYCSDMTRTVSLGEPEAEMRKIYGIVLEAQLAGIMAAKPGVTAGDVDRASRAVIENAGYGPQFGHSTGHGIGLDVHEAPTVAKDAATILTPGMVITVEPGIYLPGLGGVRIEDMVAITEEGSFVMGKVPKDLRILS